MVALEMRWMRILAHFSPSSLLGLATCRSNAIMRSSFSRTALNATSLRRLSISLAARGVPLRSTGLIGTMIVSCELHSRTRGVMVGLPE